MEQKERQFLRLRLWHRVWSTTMVLSVALIVLGIPALALWQTLGVSLIAYGTLGILLFSSFFFIVRTRYHKARLAHDARALAKARAGQRVID